MRGWPTVVPINREGSPGDVVWSIMWLSTGKERICASKRVVKLSWYALNEGGQADGDERISGLL